jgi:pyruvate kinase
MVSRLAADIQVIGATTDLPNARRMGLMRGVESLLVPRVENSDVMVDAVEMILQDQYALASGDKVVITLGLPMWRAGTTNTMKVIQY